MLHVIFLAVAELPVPESGHQAGRPARLLGQGAGRHEGDSGGQHHALLGGAQRHIDSPFVHHERHGRERGDGIDQEQRRMARRVDRRPDGRDVVDDARGGVNLDHQDGLDAMLAIGAKPLLEGCRIDRPARIAGEHLDRDAEHARQIRPGGGEQPALQRQHLIAARQDIGQRRLPGPMAIGDVDVNASRGAEHHLEIGEAGLGDVLHRAAIEIDRLTVHGRQHLVRQDRRPGRGQHLATAGDTHELASTDCGTWDISQLAGGGKEAVSSSAMTGGVSPRDRP